MLYWAYPSHGLWPRAPPIHRDMGVYGFPYPNSFLSQLLILDVNQDRISLFFIIGLIEPLVYYFAWEDFFPDTDE